MIALDLKPGQYVLQAEASHKLETYTVFVNGDHFVTVRVHVHRDGPRKPHVQYRKLDPDGTVTRKVVRQLWTYVQTGQSQHYEFEPANELDFSPKKKKLAFTKVNQPDVAHVEGQMSTTSSQDVDNMAETLDDELLTDARFALELAWHFICKHDDRNPYLTEPGKSVRSVLDKLRGGK